MTEINNFIHIIIQVNNLKNAHEFYSNVFTWKVTDIEPGSNQFYFRIADDGDFMSGSIVEIEERRGNSIFLYVNVENLEKTAEKVIEYGGIIIEPPFTHPVFSGRMMNIKDPSGNLFGLWSDQ